MKIDDLMTQLIALFPTEFSSRPSVDAWKARYREAVGQYEGFALQRGFDALMLDWVKRGAPKPAELARACVEHRPSSVRESGASKRERHDWVQRRAAELEDRWRRDNDERLRWAIENRISIPLTASVQRQAHLIAQREWANNHQTPIWKHYKVYDQAGSETAGEIAVSRADVDAWLKWGLRDGKGGAFAGMAERLEGQD